MLTRAWRLPELAAAIVVAGLIFYGWPQKPRFLKMSFVMILPPLVIMALFLGYIDEWRGYYEAYPAAFGLAIDTMRRVGVFGSGREFG
jgi:hypothetical protein